MDKCTKLHVNFFTTEAHCFFSGLTSTSFVKLYFKRIEEGHQNKTHTKKEEEEEERNEIET